MVGFWHVICFIHKIGVMVYTDRVSRISLKQSRAVINQQFAEDMRE